MYGRILVPDRSMEKISYRLMETLSKERFNQILNGEAILWVYGFIRYFDFADVERISRFCYRYVSAGFSFTQQSGGEILAQWMLAGPSDYNTHT